MKAIVFTLITVSIITSCNKNSNSCKYAAEPPVFLFQIRKDGIILNDSILSGIKISYTVDNDKKYISDLTIATDSSGVLLSGQIGSFENQTLFIEYANSLDVDTLIVQNLMPSSTTNCEYKIEKVSFNNAIVNSDTIVANKPLYIFLK